MGAQASQTLKEYVTNNVNYQQTVSSTLHLDNSTTINAINMNSTIIDNGDARRCCSIIHGEDVTILPGCSAADATINCSSFQIGQTINQEVDVVQEIDSEYAQQLSTALQNTTQSDIANALDQLQENDLLSGFGNKTKQQIETDITNNINTTLNTNTVIDIVNSITANSRNENNTTLYNCGLITGENCNIDQNISTKIVAQNILSSVADLAQNNSQINDFYTKLNNILSQKQKGEAATIADAIAAFFSTELGIILIIVGAIFIFIIIVVIIWLKASKSSPPA
jgi:uncharacterized membrane protein